MILYSIAILTSLYAIVSLGGILRETLRMTFPWNKKSSEMLYVMYYFFCIWPMLVIFAVVRISEIGDVSSVPNPALNILVIVVSVGSVVAAHKLLRDEKRDLATKTN